MKQQRQLILKSEADTNNKSSRKKIRLESYLYNIYCDIKIFIKYIKCINIIVAVDNSVGGQSE